MPFRRQPAWSRPVPPRYPERAFRFHRGLCCGLLLMMAGPAVFAAAQTGTPPSRSDANPPSSNRTESQIGGVLDIDEDRLQAHRIRKIASPHLTLYTDLPSSPAVDELGEVFSQAVDQWRSYFNDPAGDKIQAIGFLMDDRQRFERAGVIPDELPDFKNGFTWGKRTFWMYDQPSDYMRRQLMLHEGTHVYLFSRFGTTIPAWFNEGLAEWFASHHWENGRLQTGVTIASAEQAPFWGRAKLVREKVAGGQSLSLDEIRRLPVQSFLQVDPYAWVWALAAFFDQHPDYQADFRKLITSLNQQGGVEAAFDKAFGPQRSRINEQWRAFLADLDYGVNGANARLEYQPAKIERNDLRVIVADRSWQNSGVEVVAGQSYLVRARGRFVIRRSQLNGQPVDWPCEPNGVTLEYYRGQPLGKLMAVIQPADDRSKTDFNSPIPIGLSATFKAPISGNLYFRANESPAGLGDNSGQLLVSVVPIGEKN